MLKEGSRVVVPTSVKAAMTDNGQATALIVHVTASVGSKFARLWAGAIVLA
jgi:hypothetical protein